MMGWQWHQLDHNMQIICTSLQTDNHASRPTSPLSFTGRMPFMQPNQQCRSTEGTLSNLTEAVRSKRDDARISLH